MYDNVLIPIDSSDEVVGRNAIAEADKIIEKARKVTLLTVLPVIPSYVASELPADFNEGAEDKAVAELKKVAEDYNIQDKCSIVVKHGNPYPIILEIAKDIESDLIIIASHQPGWESFLLGSVASKVVDHAKCSVLVQR